MKKLLYVFLICFVSTFTSLRAQKVAVGLDGYTTNLWFAMIMPGLHYAFPIHVDRDVPDGYVFGRMYSPYRRTFSHPFHRFGDLTAGMSASVDLEDSPIGFYGALRYKTSEAHYRNLPKGDDNDRVHYIQPEVGVRAKWFSVGVAYDAVVGYNGHVHDYKKSAVKSGCNLVIGLWSKKESKEHGDSNFTLQYIHPLHNFYNKNFSPDGGITHPLKGLDYKIGYITASYRLYLDD